MNQSPEGALNTLPEGPGGADWQDLYKEHSPSVLAFLISRTRRREDAEDLLQETFVRAIRATDSIRETTRLRSFLMTVAHNLMISQYRKKTPLIAAEGGEAVEIALETAADNRTPPTDHTALFSDLDERLDTVRESLSPALKQAFELAILKQLSYDEVSRETGWSPGQVRVNVFRARKRAIEVLGDYLPAGTAT